MRIERSLLLLQKLDCLRTLLCSVLKLSELDVRLCVMTRPHLFVKGYSIFFKHCDTILLAGQVGLSHMLGELDEAGDHDLLLIRNVQDNIKFVNDVPDFALEFGLGGHVEKGEKEVRIHFVLDAGLVDFCEAFRQLP